MKLAICNINSVVTLCQVVEEGVVLQEKLMKHERAMGLAQWFVKMYGADSVVKGIF